MAVRDLLSASPSPRILASSKELAISQATQGWASGRLGYSLSLCLT